MFGTLAGCGQARSAWQLDPRGLQSALSVTQPSQPIPDASPAPVDSGAGPPPTPRHLLLFELGLAFAARLELDELVPLVVAKCREVMDAQGTSLLLLDAEAGELYFPWVDHDDPTTTASLQCLRFPADRGFAGAVVQSGTALRVDDAARDPRFFAGVDQVTGHITRAVLAVPLQARSELLGVVEVVNRRDGGCFSDDDLSLLGALAGSIAVAIENARLWAQLKTSNERLAAQVVAYRRDSARRDQFGAIVSASPAMATVFQLMESAASATITVLIEGESGTGKELVARGIHAASARAKGPLVAVNCAALSESLLERELFGHKRGAFTGATHDERGLFEAASDGTIFLDEIGEMAAPMQAKLLRVLQDGEFTPVGDTRPRRVDIRVVCATHRQLSDDIAAGRFREDLYYRLAVFPIWLPPLRDRREDVPLLADHFLRTAAERHGRRPGGIEATAMELLTAFSWPGNVRELQNEIERAVVLVGEGQRIGPEHLSEKVRAGPGLQAPATPARAAPPTAQADLREARATFEARHLAAVLHEQGNNVSRAARALGISRVALQKKMKDLGLR